jgi:hypothetical protein
MDKFIIRETSRTTRYRPIDDYQLNPTLIRRDARLLVTGWGGQKEGCSQHLQKPRPSVILEGEDYGLKESVTTGFSNIEERRGTAT